jgi:hypothetical protein
MPSAAAGGLAGGDVGPDHDNKRHRDAIGLTTVRLVVVARVELAPATAHGGDRRRRLGGSVCCGVEAKLAQTSAHVSLPGSYGGYLGAWTAASTSGELCHRRRRQWRRAARVARGGERRGLYTRLGRPVGDTLVTAEDAAVLRRVEARAVTP